MKLTKRTLHQDPGPEEFGICLERAERSGQSINKPPVDQSIHAGDRTTQNIRSCGSAAESMAAVPASFPGKIIRINVDVGDPVKSGNTLLVLEVFKMEVPIVSPQDGTVRSVQVRVGDVVGSGDVLVLLS